MKSYIIFLITVIQFCSITLFPQNKTIKADAIKEMQAGRYGEAISLLNKYINANIKDAEGYNLRGLCFEKQSQFETAVSDFKSAKKIDPTNKEILFNLSRTTEIWYKLLYSKIEGHNREIALNPKEPVNYLEIGKCYKNLGEWERAEKWYDKYMQLEEPSSDEIIHYSEILAKNKHTSRGIQILKKHIDRYPKDYRIWSRYGYFFLWDGKTKPAKEAFETALQLRPNFKEAMEGLDQANGKGYIINDTLYSIKRKSNSIPEEYSIDKYYKIINSNPDDIKTRYSLVDELIKNNRTEEAYEQLLFMQDKEEGASEKFQEIWSYLSIIRDSIYQHDVNILSEEFQNGKSSKEVAEKLSNAYAHLFDYDNAIQVLESYFSVINEDQALELRYMLTKYCAWSYQWNKAFINCNILLKYDSGNLNYQYLMAQLITWNVIDSKPEEIKLAETYLSNTLSNDPKNISAILTYAFLYSGCEKFSEAKVYLDLAKSIEPSFKQISHVENYYYLRIEIAEEKKILNKRGIAGSLAEQGDCKGALEIYNQIMSVLPNPEKKVLIEYASFCTCAKDYNNAIIAYDKILSEEFDMEIASLRAMNVMWAGDTIKAINDFLALKEIEPLNYIVNFYMGDIYERIGQQDNAKKLYQFIIETCKKEPDLLDSMQIDLFSKRLEYLNVKGSALSSLFGYMGVAPISNYYTDNQQFTFNNYGVRADINLFNSFSIGVYILQHRLKGIVSNINLFRDIISFKGNLFFKTGDLYLSAGLGKNKTNNNIQSTIFEFNAKFEQKDKIIIDINCEKNDARLILFSPNIINHLLSATIYRLNGKYSLPNKFMISSYFHYITISDGNAGNNFELRGGKSISSDLKLGYEYFYSNYSFSPEYLFNGKRIYYYYSPKSFNSHSLWGDYKIISNDNLTISLGGKLGYVPANDYIIREIYAESTYRLLNSLTLSGKLSTGSSFRENANYSYVSAFITAYLSIF